MVATKIFIAICCIATILAAYKPSRNPNISLVRTPNGGIQPQAVMERSGTLHLLYYSGDAAGGDLYYVKSGDDGRTWSAPLRVNSQSGSAVAAGTIRGGQIAIGKNGRVHVAWNGSTKAKPKGLLNPESGEAGVPMLYSRLNGARNGFEPQRELMNRTFGLDGGGTVAADSAGDVYVAWHGKVQGAVSGDSGRQVWIAKSNDDGNKFAPEQLAWKDRTGACGCCGMSMSVATNGIVRVLYRSATEDIHRDIYLLKSQDRGHSFDGLRLHPWEINACPMSSMAFSEGAGKVEGAWETGGQVYFENLTAPNAAPVSAPGESKGHKHPRIAISPNGDTLMTWTEGTGWSRGGSLAWQLYDASGKMIGEKGSIAGVAAWSFGAVVAKPNGFIVLY